MFVLPGCTLRISRPSALINQSAEALGRRLRMRKTGCLTDPVREVGKDPINSGILNES